MAPHTFLKNILNLEKLENLIHNENSEVLAEKLDPSNIEDEIEGIYQILFSEIYLKIKKLMFILQVIFYFKYSNNLTLEYLYSYN